jgi:Protein phosphatase 2C
VTDGRVNGSLNLSRALGDMEYKQSADLEAADQIVTAMPEVQSVDIMHLDCGSLYLAHDEVCGPRASRFTCRQQGLASGVQGLYLLQLRLRSRNVRRLRLYCRPPIVGWSEFAPLFCPCWACRCGG